MADSFAFDEQFSMQLTLAWIATRSSDFCRLNKGAGLLALHSRVLRGRKRHEIEPGPTVYEAWEGELREALQAKRITPTAREVKRWGSSERVLDISPVSYSDFNRDLKFVWVNDLLEFWPVQSTFPYVIWRDIKFRRADVERLWPHSAEPPSTCPPSAPRPVSHSFDVGAAESRVAEEIRRNPRLTKAAAEKLFAEYGFKREAAREMASNALGFRRPGPTGPRGAPR
jgi:hypothetical protein